MSSFASPVTLTGQHVCLASLSAACHADLVPAVSDGQRPLSAGTLRDTCVYSIIASEWPEVKAQVAPPPGRTSIKDTQSC